MNLTILHEVWPELLASGEWYELEKQGLGSTFFEAVDRTVDQVREFPLRYPQVYRNARRAQIERFPFAVFFVIEAQEIYIFSISHMHRNPRRWQRAIPRRRRRRT